MNVRMPVEMKETNELKVLVAVIACRATVSGLEASAAIVNVILFAVNLEES